MSAFFIKIYWFINKNKGLSVAVSLLMLLVFGYFASKITFEEDITRVIPKSEQGDITTKVVQQLKFSDKITVLISKSDSGTTEEMTQTASLFLEKLECCSEYIKAFKEELMKRILNKLLILFMSICHFF